MGWQRGEVFCCQQNSWEFHLVLTTDPLIGHFWVCVSAGVRATSHRTDPFLPPKVNHLTKQHSNLILIYAAQQSAGDCHLCPHSPQFPHFSTFCFLLSTCPFPRTCYLNYNCRLITLASIVVRLSYLHAPYTRIGV